ncbi:MAG: single-stranded DNA-binding protein [Candidatus Hydrogenedentota bacterium]|nr:MAG: single-stranded DNA-binding protein [Candidatus Hydrogenedentota bacterium]
MADLKMPDINKVSLAGNLTRDPELQYLPNGTPLCKLGLAVSRKYKTKSGELKENTLFINVTAWRGTAEYCGNNMRKGMPVLVEGRLTSDEWEDKNTGQKRTKIEVTADRVQGLAWEDRNSGGGGSSYNQSSQSGQSAQSGAPSRPTEEPIPDDDIPF